MATIALLEPYYTGSHKDWVDGLGRHSRHEIVPFTLPGRFWKWRMHGGAVSLAKRYIVDGVKADIVLTTDMLDLTSFLALIGTGPVTAIYFHENQLTYPPPPGTKRDLHYGYINYASALAADAVFFNSMFHRASFLDELIRLLKHFPDFNELWTLDLIRSKSKVLPLGIELTRFDEYKCPPRDNDEPLLIVWNHRWEYDKAPGVFLNALYALQSDGISFQLAILGQNFRNHPEEFIDAEQILGDKLVHCGFADSFEDYARWLWEADVQVSTADQEFFGAATVEAMYCNCLPLLPRRLAYPEIIPGLWHDKVLYRDKEELQALLRKLALKPENARRQSLHEVARLYDWKSLIARYDEELSLLLEGKRNPPLSSLPFQADT